MVANLLYNMSGRRISLLVLWGIAAFDEVAGIPLSTKMV